MKKFSFNDANALSTMKEINVTSLVDVMTVLLIIFMIPTPMIQSGIQVELPKAQAAAPDLEEGLVVTVSKDQRVFLEERELSLDEFDAVFRAVYPVSENRPVFIRADMDAPWNDVVTVIDRLKAQGVTTVGLATNLQSSQ